MGAGSSVDPSSYAAMLATVRRRRWYFWGLVLIYLPTTITILKLTQSTKLTAIAFGIWVVFLCIVVALMACSKCPHATTTFTCATRHSPFQANAAIAESIIGSDRTEEKMRVSDLHDLTPRHFPLWAARHFQQFHDQVCTARIVLDQQNSLRNAHFIAL